MAKEKKKVHPESLEKQNEVKFSSEDIRNQFVKDLNGEIDDAIAARGKWENRQTRWYKKRYGIRPKKSFPWPGCANLHIPLTDKTIRKIKPSYVNLIWASMPYVCDFVGMGMGPEDDTAAAELNEPFFDWLFKVRMRAFKPTVLLVDKMLEKGFSLAKILWETKTRRYTQTISLKDIPPKWRQVIEDPLTTDDELAQYLADAVEFNLDDENESKQVWDAVRKYREGDQEFQFEMEEFEYNAPKLLCKDPKDVIVPADTTDLQLARWIADRSWFTYNDLKLGAYDEKYEDSAVKDLGARLNKTSTGQKPNVKRDLSQYSTLESTKDNREGMSDFIANSDLIEIMEVCCYYDINGDGIDEKCILTYPKEYPEIILRFIEYPYAHNRWPYVKIPFEYNDERYHSPRGAVEILDPIQTEITVQHNNKLDRQTLTTAPFFKFVPGTINPSNIRFIPNQGVPVPRMDVLEVVQLQDMSYSFEKEEMILKAWAEEYIGVMDFGIGNVAKMSERRTATEIDALKQDRNQVFSLDARIFQDAMAEVYYQTWALWMQYGEDEIHIKITGQPKPRMVRKEDIMGQFNIVPSGTLQNTNPVMEAQKSLADITQFANDPYIDQYELRKDYWLRRDVKKMMRVLKPRKMAEAEIKQNQQMQIRIELAKAGRTNIDLTEGQKRRGQNVNVQQNLPQSLTQLNR